MPARQRGEAPTVGAKRRRYLHAEPSAARAQRVRRRARATIREGGIASTSQRSAAFLRKGSDRKRRSRRRPAADVPTQAGVGHAGETWSGNRVLDNPTTLVETVTIFIYSPFPPPPRKILTNFSAWQESRQAARVIGV